MMKFIDVSLRKATYVIFTVLFVATFFSSCTTDETIPDSGYSEDQVAIAQVQGDRPNLVLPSSQMSKAMTVYFSNGFVVEETELRYSEGSKLYYLVNKGVKDGRRKSVAIFLKSQSVNLYLPFVNSCTHECTASETNGCSGGCDIGSIVMCKSHTCTCTGTGGCDAKVSGGGSEQIQADTKRIRDFRAFFANETD